ncbi:MAG: KH domain-containing protein [Bacillota bacterium]|nr:KH domain-containing protein [Bacillota bacterium]
MKDYEALIHPLIDPLIEKPEAVVIRELPGGNSKEVTVLIVAEDDDCARLIGRRGAIANALREVINIAGKADDTNTWVHLRFESFSEGEKEKDE